MKRLPVLLVLGTAPLAAQNPMRFTAAASVGVTHHAHRDGTDTTSANGTIARLELGGRLGRVGVAAWYAEGPSGSARIIATGGVDACYALSPRIAIGIGLDAVADAPDGATARRWWSVDIGGRVHLPLPATPFLVDSWLALAPIGGVNDSRGFTSAWGMGVGIAYRPTRYPVDLRMAYDLRRATAGTLADAVETITFGSVWRF